MVFLNRPAFWGLLIVGWFVSATILSLVARYFSSYDDMTRTQLCITAVTINVLAALSGFAFARSHCGGPGNEHISK